jgi:hypothetical protein
MICFVATLDIKYCEYDFPGNLKNRLVDHLDVRSLILPTTPPPFTAAEQQPPI